MNYITVAPCEELKDFVSHFWAGWLSTEEQTHFIYHSTANTHTEIAFAFKPSTGPHPTLVFSSVQGHTAGFGQFSANSFVNIVGVSLFSYAAPLFLNVSPSNLSDQFTDLDTLLGNGGRMINEKMSSALTTQDYIKVLSDYFKSQLSKKYFEDKLMIKAIKLIRKHYGIIAIHQLVASQKSSLKGDSQRIQASNPNYMHELFVLSPLYGKVGIIITLQRSLTLLATMTNLILFVILKHSLALLLVNLLKGE